MEWHEEQHRMANCIYRVFEDGTVVAYGREIDGPRDNLWIASAWSKHPLDFEEEARHLTHIAADSTLKELGEALKDWADPAQRLQYFQPSDPYRRELEATFRLDASG